MRLSAPEKRHLSIDSAPSAPHSRAERPATPDLAPGVDVNFTSGVQHRSASLDFLAGGGETGALMRSHDFLESPLGPPQYWPQSLKTVVTLLLQSQFPMFVAWGNDLGFLYNDPYAEILGAKHPRALGRPFHDIWSEIWARSEEHTSELQSQFHLVCRLLLEKKKH